MEGIAFALVLQLLRFTLIPQKEKLERFKYKLVYLVIYKYIINNDIHIKSYSCDIIKYNILYLINLKFYSR